MAYRYYSRRSRKRLARRSWRNFIFTFIIIGALIYAALKILPILISGIGLVRNSLTPPAAPPPASKESNLAPPVLNIPYEATNTAQINISGYGSPRSKVRLYLDDKPSQTANVSSEGSFTFENVTLSLGTNNIYGTTLDEANKESLPGKTIKLIFDNEKPPLEISEPADNKKIEGGDKKVKVSGKTEPAVKVFVNDAQVIVDKDGSFNTEQVLNDGDNIITIKALDTASNATQIQRLVTYTPSP